MHRSLQITFSCTFGSYLCQHSIKELTGFIAGRGQGKSSILPGLHNKQTQTCSFYILIFQATQTDVQIDAVPIFSSAVHFLKEKLEAQCEAETNLLLSCSYTKIQLVGASNETKEANNYQVYQKISMGCPAHNDSTILNSVELLANSSATGTPCVK